jgi:hypothetical protein
VCVMCVCVWMWRDGDERQERSVLTSPVSADVCTSFFFNTDVRLMELFPHVYIRRGGRV